MGLLASLRTRLNWSVFSRFLTREGTAVRSPFHVSVGSLCISFRFMVAVPALGWGGFQALAGETAGGGECLGAQANVDVRLELPPAADAVRVIYRASHDVSAFALGLPVDELLRDRLQVKPLAEFGNDGSLVLYEPSRTLVLDVRPDPPAYKMAGQYPLAFRVAGRGIGELPGDDAKRRRESKSSCECE